MPDFKYELQVVPNADLPEVKGIIYPKFWDHRGSYAQIYDAVVHTDIGCPEKFVQDCVSTSAKYVLRGIHGDYTTWKLISCLYGQFDLVVVDNRRKSPTYLKHVLYHMHSADRFQVLVPPGFGNGHCVLSDVAVFYYKQSTAYNRGSQFTLRWNDPVLGIQWYPPAEEHPVILSDRDANAPFIAGSHGS